MKDVDRGAVLAVGLASGMDQEAKAGQVGHERVVIRLVTQRWK
jgi:hypothetical protein